MILFNLCGGPGSGKTTLAYYLTYRFKKEGFRTEFVGEAAREEHIYDSVPGQIAPPLLDNQVLLLGQQYERIIRLRRHGMEVLISDSPLIQGLMYCEGQFYYNPLFDLARVLEKDFKTVNVFVQRKRGCYDAESRNQGTEEEAAAFDDKVKLLFGTFWKTTFWGYEEHLAVDAIKLVKQWQMDANSNLAVPTQDLTSSNP